MDRPAEKRWGRLEPADCRDYLIGVRHACWFWCYVEMVPIGAGVDGYL